MHISGRGDVSSSRPPTAPGMVLQCPGWWHSGGDIRTGSEVTEETRSTGLMSRRCPARAWVDIRTSFEGSVVLFRGVQRGGRTGVGGTASQS
jgi:hypothetical protein